VVAQVLKELGIYESNCVKVHVGHMDGDVFIQADQPHDHQAMGAFVVA
jgi:hypothetical protein